MRPLIYVSLFPHVKQSLRTPPPPPPPPSIAVLSAALSCPSAAAQCAIRPSRKKPRCITVAKPTSPSGSLPCVLSLSARRPESASSASAPASASAAVRTHSRRGSRILSGAAQQQQWPARPNVAVRYQSPTRGAPARRTHGLVNRGEGGGGGGELTLRHLQPGLVWGYRLRRLWSPKGETSDLNKNWAYLDLVTGTYRSVQKQMYVLLKWLNPRTAGGTYTYVCLHRFFAESVITATRSAAKFVIPIHSSFAYLV